uniref:Beta-glucosidase n=1 Tax=Kalanchoe fedtschenkoi TaxID=63787 RepID=A0A7N0V1W1_KALFE
MEIKSCTIWCCVSLFLCQLSVLLFPPVCAAGSVLSLPEGEEVKRSDFPDGFLFGAASSSYQVEGAHLEDGRGWSNWDIFTRLPGEIEDGSNGDISTDHYHRYLEDIEKLQSMGADAYRFSISWSRILPRGRFGDVNPSGIAFYDRLIDALLVKGIKPFVTLYHHEVPQALEDKFGSWLSPLMQDEFVTFAEVCFKSFGDRVQYWMTINEPNLFTQFAYMTGSYPPGRCSPPFGNCSAGNSLTEPLIAMHNMLLAHAKAAKLYRDKYQAQQGGLVGIVGSFSGYEPLTSSVEDAEAVNRAFIFNFGWMLDPLIFGDYPVEMRNLFRSDLPLFSPAEIQIVKGSVDFIGVNHYTVLYVNDCLHPSPSCSPKDANPASGFLRTGIMRDGVPIGDQTAFWRFCVVPRGMEKVVNYLKERYNNTPLFITENGYAGEPEENIQNSLNDYKRVEYMKSYLAALARATRNGADVRGYFVWSLLDSFEWEHGYRLKFGLHYVDFTTQRRTPRLSAKWYSRFMAEKDDGSENEEPGMIKEI